MVDYPRWPDRTGFDLDTYVAGAASMWERMLRRFNYLHRVGHPDGIAPLDADGLVPAENLPASSGGTGIVETVVAGTGISVDSTDPAHPVVSATGGGGGGAVDSVNGQTGTVVLAAADVDAVAEPTAWTSITLDSGYASHADNFGYPPQYRKVGDRVELRGIIRKNPSAAFTNVGAAKVATLPAGHRPVAAAGSAAASDPTKSIAFGEAGAGGPAIARWEVNPSGELKVAAGYQPGTTTGPTWVSLDGVSFSTS